MEMERINEDTIKVLIMPEDLEERGINFLELISNHARIEQFFYSILEEVDVENQFAESDSVTFHVIPSDRGLELYISRSSGNGLEDLLENEVLKRLLDRRKSALKDKQQAQDQEDLSVNEKLEVLELSASIAWMISSSWHVNYRTSRLKIASIATMTPTIWS